jgi:Tetratricopeptide repeat
MDGSFVRPLVRDWHPLFRFYDSLCFYLSFEPNAEKTCEDLLSLALQADPGNPEALQALASVRMSQQRPDDAKGCLEEAWSAWKDLEPGKYLLR